MSKLSAFAVYATASTLWGGVIAICFILDRSAAFASLPVIAQLIFALILSGVVLMTIPITKFVSIITAK